MPPFLIFLFLFQSGLAFAFTYFIVRLLMNGGEGRSLARLSGAIRKVRNISLGVCAVLPPLMFAAYYLSLPKGKPISLAVLPALWILMILMGVVLALSLANNPPGGKVNGS